MLVINIMTIPNLCSNSANYLSLAGGTRRREVKVTKMVALMIIAFLFAWTPYAILALAAQYFYVSQLRKIGLSFNFIHWSLTIIIFFFFHSGSHRPWLESYPVCLQNHRYAIIQLYMPVWMPSFPSRWENYWVSRRSGAAGVREHWVARQLV